MSAVFGSGRLALAALALSLGLACSAPASAEYFSPIEGFSESGAPKVTLDASPYLFLPNVNATIGLDRPAGADVTVDRSRPTVADVLASLSFAFDCDCIVRFGNLSGEVNVIYVDLKEKTTAPALPPRLPAVVIDNKMSVFLISPGLGYRVFSSIPYKISLDARAGFTYAAFSADAEFQAGEFSTAGSHTISYAVPWIGERFGYYPSRRWRLENDFSITGLGANNGTIGYTGKLSATYAVSKWFDVQFGYAVVDTKRNPDILNNGANRTLHLLLYGPVAGFGFRF